MATNEPVEEVIGNYRVHPVAAMFPMLEGQQYEDLKKSIAEVGQQESIIIQNGILIDGRNRLKVLTELNREPIIREYTSALPVETFILVQNLHRRHLTDDQRIMIAAQAMHRQEAEAAKARKRDNQGGRGNRKSYVSGNEKNLAAKSTQGFREPTVTEKIAEVAKGTDYAARQAVAVIQDAPELVEPVVNGKLRLRDAQKEVHQRRSSKPKAASSDGHYSERSMNAEVLNDTAQIFNYYKLCWDDGQEKFKQKVYRKLAQLWGPPEDTRSLSQRWDDAVDELKALQQEYQNCVDKMPKNLQSSAKAEALRAIADIDLSELENVEFP